jgi:hypothetical protein
MPRPNAQQINDGSIDISNLIGVQKLSQTQRAKLAQGFKFVVTCPSALQLAGLIISQHSDASSLMK